MISPRYKLTNRADKRLFQFEANKVLKPLMTIEAQFFDLLFDESQQWSYRAIYHTFRDKYVEKAVRLSLDKKMLQVDLDYFDNKYKPLEQ